MMSSEIHFFESQPFPLEMHKVRIIQKLNLLPVEGRLRAMKDAGFNTFLLKNDAIFLDMLTDSGVNAMSDRQLAAMMVADDSYAGSMSFERLKTVASDIFGKEFILPVHQGRAAENIDRKSTRLNSSHYAISYAVFCLKKKKCFLCWYG